MTLLLFLICAASYGTTMKFADLLNEHKLKWFKGSALLFGILWGLFGALLIMSHNAVANIILAMNIAFIIRNRLDYLNHQAAATIIIISFLFFAKFEPIIFIAFWLIFLICGAIKDYTGDVLKIKNGLFRFLFEYAMIYYPLPTFIYSLLFNDWAVFYVFTTYIIAYGAVKYFGARRGYA